MATLEELDAFGTMDNIDSLGTLEQLDNLTLHQASGTGAIAITESASAVRMQQAVGAGALAITTTATANFLVNAAGTGAIAITESTGAILIHGMSSADIQRIKLNADALITMIKIPSMVDATLSITESANLFRIQSVTASDILTITASLITGEILGETWTDVSGRDVVWSTLQ